MAKKEISRPQTAHIAPFGLRLQPQLKERIETAAKENGRSMNAEITDRLEASFAPSREEVLVGEAIRRAAELSGWKDAFKVVASEATAQIAAYVDTAHAAFDLAKSLDADIAVLAHAIESVALDGLTDEQQVQVREIFRRHQHHRGKIQQVTIPEPKPLASVIREFAAKENASTGSQHIEDT